MTNEKTLKRKEILTYRFYIDVGLIVGLAIVLALLKGMLSNWKGIADFPDTMTAIFIICSAAFAAALAYKIVAIIRKTQMQILSANYTLVWTAAMFIASGLLFLQTLDTRAMNYDPFLTTYGILLAVYAILCLVNFFFGGDLFERAFKKLFARKK